MRILYGVVGEGMGHATRSRVILEHLLGAGHDVRVVVSGKAHDFLRRAFKDRPRIGVEEIHGLSLTYDGNALDIAETLMSNLDKAPEGIARNVEVYGRVAREGFDPQMVVSDFESWAYLFGVRHGLPVVSIDNMQVLDRCKHDDDVKGDGLDFWLAKTAVKVKLPWAYHYLVTSFFFPPVRRRRTTLVPPILRPEILAARREPGDHVVVYVRAAEPEELVAALAGIPLECRVYGFPPERIAALVPKGARIVPCAFSETGFVDDLRTARAVIAGGGYSLMGEAVHLRVPMLAVPIEGQYEQELNARYLQKLGYGAWARRLDPVIVAGFLGECDQFEQGLQHYEPRDNGMLFACVDELVHDVEIDEPAPERLRTPNLGAWHGKPLEYPEE